MSRKIRTPSPACGSLQKSCSEPIDIRQPLRNAAHTLTPNTPPLNTVPSHSVSDFSDFMTSQQMQEEQQQVFREQFSAQMVTAHQSPRTVFASPPSKGQVGFGPHVLRLRGLNDTPTSTDSSGEEGGNSGAPHIQFVGAAPQLCAMSDASSQTDFSSLKEHQPKSKPNLYSMTPVELLNLPENTYFRSSLSDKMSDYEDIWRSSYYDTDSVKNGSVKGATGYDVGSCVTARSDFSKFFAINGSKDASGAVQPVSVVVTPDPEPQQVATDSPPPVPKKLERNPIDPKLLHPVGRLTRLKSSSESSLATIASPVYAEPADAVVFREKQNHASRGRVRRRSAPSVSSQSVLPEHTHQSKQQSQTVSQASKPQVFFPSHTKDQSENVRLRKLSIQPPKSSNAEAKQRSGGMSRSQSMRTPQEVARLAQKKPGWQERFNRLKLGTKVLSNSGSPYAATTHSAKPQLDESLFVVEENGSGKSGASGTPLLNKFPVYQRGRPIHPANRGSYFSESSTVQDIISCAMPELMVRPIQTQRLVVPSEKPLSEYDNFNPYAPPSASSHGTIFCTPWEGGMADTLMRSDKTHLPPAMDLQERVQKWQEANQTFHQHHQQQQKRQLESKQRELVKRQQQLQQGVGQPATTVVQTTTVTPATNTGVGHPGDASNVSGRLVSAGRGVAKPQRHVHPIPHTSAVTPSQARPQSMYHQAPGHDHAKHQLTRSFSNPNQPLPSNQQEPRGHASHPHLHHHRPHPQVQLVRQTATETSSVTPDSQTGGLSSNCPDVVNCHHIVTDAGVTGLSDDEALVQSVTSTLQRSRQQQCKYMCLSLSFSSSLLACRGFL